MDTVAKASMKSPIEQYDGNDLVSCHARTDVSCSSFDALAALRLQSHSTTMFLQPRLASAPNQFAILRHFLRDTTLADRLAQAGGDVR